MADVLTEPQRIQPAEDEPLGPRDAGLSMTLEQFDQADYELGHRYELIHGVLIVTPPPAAPHRDGNDELGYRLRRYRDDHPQGKALDRTLPEQEVKTSVGVRRCDRAIWAGLGRRPVAGEDVPTIVVEFVSARAWSRRRDYVEKRDEYLAIGAKEYWIIDRFVRSMTVLVNQDGKWNETRVPAGRTYETPLLPGFTLPIAPLVDVDD